MEWIQISHKPPYSSGELLVTFTPGENVYLVDIMIYDKAKRTFTWSKAYKKDMTDNVVAWMPLPQPYRKIR